MDALDWTLLIASVVAVLVIGTILFARWGIRWGATRDERDARMSGDAYLAGGPPVRTAMTRAVSLDASPEVVWPWLAQLGRGAGWYSLDGLDNGNRASAEHIVTWIPEPALGDASAIGYLRHVAPGEELIWWTPGLSFLGAHARLVVDLRLRRDGSTSRLVVRMSADASGAMARPALWVFQVIDSVMAIRQLRGVRRRVAQFGARTSNPHRPETGARDQFQCYEVRYASGERAGVPGKEHAARWRQAALEDGVLKERVRSVDASHEE